MWTELNFADQDFTNIQLNTFSMLARASPITIRLCLGPEDPKSNFGSNVTVASMGLEYVDLSTAYGKLNLASVHCNVVSRMVSWMLQI